MVLFTINNARLNIAVILAFNHGSLRTPIAGVNRYTPGFSRRSVDSLHYCRDAYVRSSSAFKIRKR